MRSTQALMNQRPAANSMRKELNDALNVIMRLPPQAYAFLYGSDESAGTNGVVYLYPLWDGSLVVADVSGLPYAKEKCSERIFGFHIHEGSKCAGNETDPFADVGGHFNPHGCQHPEHAGDLPPLFGNDGYALSMFYTNRFIPEEVVGKTIIIHDMADDFRTQPSGDSGMKIACGEIYANDTA